MNKSQTVYVAPEALILDSFFSEHRSAIEQTGEGLLDSFERFGCAVIKLGRTERMFVERTIAASKTFFALPGSLKRQYTAHKPGASGLTVVEARNRSGFSGAAMQHEFWTINRETASCAQNSEYYSKENLWPKEVVGFQHLAESLYQSIDAFTVSVLRALAMGLGAPEGHFSPMLVDGICSMRLRHRPPQPAGDARRAKSQCEYGLLAFLLGAGGSPITVVHRKNRKRIMLTLKADEALVIPGEVMQLVTSDRITASVYAYDRIDAPEYPIECRFAGNDAVRMPLLQPAAASRLLKFDANYALMTPAEFAIVRHELMDFNADYHHFDDSPGCDVA